MNNSSTTTRGHEPSGAMRTTERAGKPRRVLLWTFCLTATLIPAAIALTYLVVVDDGLTTLRTVQEQVARLTPGPVAGVGARDGRIGARSVSVRDTDLPAIANLDPTLRSALGEATRDAAADGVELLVTSGWRSHDYQQRLLDQAIQKYGSRAEARRWVSTPQLSAHVSGDAVDIGPTDAAHWMLQHGPTYGLCQAYENEIWHYQLLTRPGGTCPTPRPDAAA